MITIPVGRPSEWEISSATWNAVLKWENTISVEVMVLKESFPDPADSRVSTIVRSGCIAQSIVNRATDGSTNFWAIPI